MNVGHEQLALADKFAVLLPLDGPYSDGAAAVHVESIGLAGVHLGMGRAVAHQGALADLGVDASGDQEGDMEVGILQLQRLIKAEEGVLGGTVGAP